MLLLGLCYEGHLLVKSYSNLNTMQVLNKFLWKNGTGNCVKGVVNSRTGNGPVWSTSCENPYNTFKIALWNICTMRGRWSKIVKTITRNYLCCVQPVRWRGALAKLITGNNSNHGKSGVAVLLAEKWVDKVYDIKHVSGRIKLINLLSQYYLSMPLKQDWRSLHMMHSMTAWKLSSLNYQIKR